MYICLSSSWRHASLWYCTGEIGEKPLNGIRIYRPSLSREIMQPKAPRLEASIMETMGTTTAAERP